MITLDEARQRVTRAVRQTWDKGDVRCLGAGCWGCCRGMVEVRPDEVERVAAVMDPEAWERVRAPFEANPEERICPLLDPKTKACSVYAERPLMCRSFLSIDNPARCYPEYVGSQEVRHPAGPIGVAADAVLSEGPALDLLTALRARP